MTDEFPNRNEFNALADRVVVVERSVADVREEVAQIKGILPSLATKADVSAMAERLSAKIDSSINGLLKDALGAIPAKFTVWFTAISALAMLAGTVVAVVQLVK